ncbi:amidase [Alicyclobacillus fodiniaquatilis]|uniref:Amidase n=1 Tax=Alicyclobacillus fodiniaquatilis TaxID=1661150 RepID=A0ABW4JQ23_9BACL
MSLTLAACLTQLSENQKTSVEITEHYLQQIAEINPRLNAYLHVCSDGALQAAHAVDKLRAQYPQALGRLAGAPISVKDLFDTSFAPTSYGNARFRQHRPSMSAIAIQRLQDAQAIILGKTHLHEFAYGVTNENPHFGPARNPVDEARMTGGSSGGSASSVRADLAVASVGTDTGGSVRIPAAFTGVVGYKPTHGYIPLEGAFPLAPTLDHIGPITHTVEDAAILTDVLAQTETAHSLVHQLRSPRAQRLRVGVPQSFVDRYATDAIGQAFEACIALLCKQGVIEVHTFDFPMPTDEIGVHQANIMGAEAFAHHAEDLVSHAQTYGEDVFERLMAAADITAKDYIRALDFRRYLQSFCTDILTDNDVILLPTTPMTAPIIGTVTIQVHGNEVPLRQLMTRFTNPWNLTGFPAITLPAGTIAGLPFGLQMVRRWGHDGRLLRDAAYIERHICHT